MTGLPEERPRSGWHRRILALAVGGVVIYLSVAHLGAFALFAVVGVVLVLVYVLDNPQLLFAAIDAARHKVAGVEHAGRHEWYGFRGTRLRLFLDETGAPWIAVKELAHVLQIADPSEAFRHFTRAEFAAPPFAGGEKCLSEAGLRRLLRNSRHPDAAAFMLWFEREVLFPLQKRKERFSGKPDGG